MFCRILGPIDPVFVEPLSRCSVVAKVPTYPVYALDVLHPEDLRLQELVWYKPLTGLVCGFGVWVSFAALVQAVNQTRELASQIN